jgi:hypothetical protein
MELKTRSAHVSQFRIRYSCYSLSQLEKFFPVWELPIQVMSGSADDWVSEETNANQETADFDQHVSGREQRCENHKGQNGG